MIEVIIDSFDLNVGSGLGTVKNSGRKVRLGLTRYKVGDEKPITSVGSSVWCVFSKSAEHDVFEATEIYNRRSERQEKFLREFREHYANQKGEPISGEILIRSNGKRCRINEVDYDHVQPCGNDFFAGRELTAGYSGSLDEPIHVEDIELVSGLAPAQFWTWANGTPAANNDFSFEVDVRVWREK